MANAATALAGRDGRPNAAPCDAVERQALGTVLWQARIARRIASACARQAAMRGHPRDGCKPRFDGAQAFGRQLTIDVNAQLILGLRVNRDRSSLQPLIPTYVFILRGAAQDARIEKILDRPARASRRDMTVPIGTPCIRQPRVRDPSSQRAERSSLLIHQHCKRAFDIAPARFRPRELGGRFPRSTTTSDAAPATAPVAVEVGQNRVQPTSHIATVEKMPERQCGAPSSILHQIICGLGITRQARE